MVAVTGDDNSGGPAPTDSTGINGAISADDRAADQSFTAESAEIVAESDAVAAPAAAAAEGDQDSPEASEDTPSAPDLEQES